MYKNKDVFAEKDGKEIANKVSIFFEKEMARYDRRSWTPIALELRDVAIDEILRIFSNERLVIKQERRNNEWREQAQDKIYPELKQDLVRFFPS